MMQTSILAYHFMESCDFSREFINLITYIVNYNKTSFIVFYCTNPRFKKSNIDDIPCESLYNSSRIHTLI